MSNIVSVVNTKKSLSSNALPALAESSLDAYFNKIYCLPVLTPEEELSLAERYQATQDLSAAHELVLSHLRYVAKIAKQYMGYGLALSDLIQEGNIGLMKAVKRFDPTMGVRLVTFAVHWVKAEMHEFIIRNWRIVRIATTKAQRKLFFNLRKHKPDMNWLSLEEMQDIAHKLGVGFQEVKEMEMRLYAHDSHFDAPAQNETQDGSRTIPSPREYLVANQSIIDADPLDQLEQKVRGQKASSGISQALSVLDERARDIIEQRWLVEPEKVITLKELANKYQMSIERVRQLEQAALKKLKLAIEPV
jgi:RNA polymerase sigma-32 factor